MLVEHVGKRPRIDPTATVAPNAVICGDVTIGADTCVLFGAVITAESGPVTIGRRCIVMEQAVIRGVKNHPVHLADDILIGPHAHLTGCTIEDEVFIATGSAIFNGAHIGAGSTVRINGVVHVNTVLPARSSMPIGWIALGNPAELYSPSDRDAVGAKLTALKFSRTVFDIDRPDPSAPVMRELALRYTKALARHADDRLLDLDEGIALP